MTDAEMARDAFGSYHAALAALRLRLVASGEVVAREDEPLDIVLLAALCSRCSAAVGRGGAVATNSPALSPFDKCSGEGAGILP